MNRYVAALRQACMDTLGQSDETNVRGWYTVESAARTVFGYCAHRPAAIDGPHSGDRLHWCVCSSALIYSSALNSAHTRILLMRYMVGMTASESDRRMVNWMALFFLCVNDTPHLLARLLKAERSAVDAVDNKQWTALMFAAHGGHEQCALELLKAGAAVDRAGSQGFTALMLAAQNNHEKCLIELLKANADSNKAAEDGFTALMAAAQDGHEQCARALLKAGAAVDATEEDGWTALMFACDGGHDQCARALLKAGARKDTTTHKGSTALSLARQNGHDALCRLLE